MVMLFSGLTWNLSRDGTAAAQTGTDKGCLHHPLWPNLFQSSSSQMLSPVSMLHWQPPLLTEVMLQSVAPASGLRKGQTWRVDARHSKRPSLFVCPEGEASTHHWHWFWTKLTSTLWDVLVQAGWKVYAFGHGATPGTVCPWSLFGVKADWGLKPVNQITLARNTNAHVYIYTHTYIYVCINLETPFWKHIQSKSSSKQAQPKTFCRYGVLLSDKMPMFTV